MKKIYLMGSLNADFTVTAPYLPAAGETLKGNDFRITAGGKGANQAYAAASLGASVKMAGCVGRDFLGDLLLAALDGVDVSLVRRGEGTTGCAIITVIDGNNRIILHEGCNGETGKRDAEALLADAKAGDIFMTQLETPTDGVIFALRLAKEKGLFTMLNPAPAGVAGREAVKYADLVTPNETELRILSGKEDLCEGVKELLSLGAGAVLVTLGAQGSLYQTRTERIFMKCVEIGKTVDTTGAGDTYLGALASRLARGEEMERAMRFASVAAGITVTRRGAIAAIPSLEEAEAAMRNARE